MLDPEVHPSLVAKGRLEQNGTRSSAVDRRKCSRPRGGAYHSAESESAGSGSAELSESLSEEDPEDEELSSDSNELLDLAFLAGGGSDSKRKSSTMRT